MLTNKRPQFARKTMQIGGYALAIGLLAASLWYAMQGQRIEDWWVLLRAKPWLTAGLFATVTLSGVILPGILFWLVTRPFVSGRPLSMASMQALAAGGGLLNYTPFKAGLIGRITYLKIFHGVGYKAAALTHAVIAGVFGATCLLTILVTVWRGNFDIVWWATTLIGLIILAGIAAPILRILIPTETTVDPRLRGSIGGSFAYLLPCFAAQLLGLCITAIRWWLVFQILDRPIALADAWMAAIIHMVSITAGPANGIGLREWLIGIGGQLGGLSSSLDMDMRASRSAALIDRAVEASVLIVLGLLGLAFLRFVTRHSTVDDTAAEQSRTTDNH